MTVVGLTDYIYVGDLECGLTLQHDNTNYGGHGFGGLQDDVIMFIQMFVEHKQTVQFNLHVRIHQPTVNFNNNTQAIWAADFFGTHLDGTAGGDHGDFNVDYTTTYTNYGPNRWILIEFHNAVGSVEFTWTAVNTCTYLDDPPAHAAYSTVPRERTRQSSGGGWSVGQA